MMPAFLVEKCHDGSLRPSTICSSRSRDSWVTGMVMSRQNKQQQSHVGYTATERHIRAVVGRGMSLTRTPLRIGVDIVKNIVEKHGCFVLVIT